MDECSCSNYEPSKTEDVFIANTNVCGLEFIERPLGPTFEINGIRFRPSTNAMYLLSLNTIYNFYINSDGHPVHFHVFPFQVQEDLLNGYIAQSGDWVDTLGYNDLSGDRSGFYVRMNIKDFTGNVVVHCHFFAHEDFGMMAFMKVVDGLTNDLSRDKNQSNDLLLVKIVIVLFTSCNLSKNLLWLSLSTIGGFCHLWFSTFSI